MKKLFVILLVLFVGSVLIGCGTTTSTTTTTKINYSYEILKKTTNSSGVRMEILLTENMDNVTKDGLKQFVKAVTSKYDDVGGAIYLSKKAYQEDQSGNYTDEFDKGLLIAYAKNSRVHQFTYVQVKGKFSNLAGNKVEF